RRARRAAKSSYITTSSATRSAAQGEQLAVSSHTFDHALELRLHRRRRRRLVAEAVARQHPLEIEIEEPAHRSRLRGPRVPADAARDGKLAAVRCAPQVIAGEQI